MKMNYLKCLNDIISISVNQKDGFVTISANMPKVNMQQTLVLMQEKYYKQLYYK